MKKSEIQSSNREKMLTIFGWNALCRSRRELSNAYLLAKIGVDAAENEPLEVWGQNSIQYSLHSLEVTLPSFFSLRRRTARPSQFPTNTRDKVVVDEVGT